MYLSVLTKVSARINGPFPRSTVNLVYIQSSKSFWQTHNVQVLPRRPKAINLGQAAEQRPSIRKFALDYKKNSCC